jgi:hypothetical protein
MNAGAQAYALRYQSALQLLSPGMTLSTDDRRLAWECARDDAHLAFRIWCEAPLGAKRDAYTAYRAAADREDVAIASLIIS